LIKLRDDKGNAKVWLILLYSGPLNQDGVGRGRICTAAEIAGPEAANHKRPNPFSNAVKAKDYAIEAVGFV
jgi:hypothetical protein